MRIRIALGWVLGLLSVVSVLFASHASAKGEDGTKGTIGMLCISESGEPIYWLAGSPMSRDFADCTGTISQQWNSIGADNTVESRDEANGLAQWIRQAVQVESGLVNSLSGQQPPGR